MSRSLREDDSPGLFGLGIGISTTGNVHCDWCGRDYTDRESVDGDRTWGENIGIADFGDKQVLDCCWEQLERAVLDRMRDILPWYRKILDRRAAVLKSRQDALAAVERPEPE